MLVYIVDLLEDNCFPRIDNRQWQLCPSPSVLQPCLFWAQCKSSCAALAFTWSLVSRWCLGINPAFGGPGRSFVFIYAVMSVLCVSYGGMHVKLYQRCGAFSRVWYKPVPLNLRKKNMFLSWTETLRFS